MDLKNLMIARKLAGGGSSSGEEPTLQDKEITENGVYSADAGYDGLGLVTVNIPIKRKELVKVGEVTVSDKAVKLNVTHIDGWEDFTIDDFYVVLKTFTVFSTKGDSTGPITCGTYDFIKSYNNGSLALSRESVKGEVGIKFESIVYVLVDGQSGGGGDLD